jgi:hypothetical protein
MEHTRPTGNAARATAARTVAVLVQLTLVLGLTVAVSWLAFGGRGSFNGPDRVLRDSWPLIYGSQAVMAAIGLLIFARREIAELGLRRLGALVVGAWLGELLALTLGGNLLANELDPNVAWFYWLMGTGGPLQPAAAFAGGLLGIRLRRGDAPLR